MPPPDDRSALRDIQHAAGLIERFVLGLSEDQFLDDALVQSGTERQLGIIGEAVKRLTPEFRQRHPDVDWRGWAGLRDILVHAYDDINLGQIWPVVQTDLPAFRRFVDAELEHLES